MYDWPETASAWDALWHAIRAELTDAGIEAAPGSVVEFLLDGSAGSPHSFVLTGTAPGSEMDQFTADDGDTIIRIRVPQDGALSFICTIPGHEGLHGTLVVPTGGASQADDAS